MKKLLRCGISTLLIAMLSIQMLCIHAVAAEHPSIKLPVTIEQKGDYPYKAEELNVVLKAADTACPMPEGSADGAYTLVDESCRACLCRNEKTRTTTNSYEQN